MKREKRRRNIRQAIRRMGEAPSSRHYSKPHVYTCTVVAVYWAAKRETKSHE